MQGTHTREVEKQSESAAAEAPRHEQIKRGAGRWPLFDLGGSARPDLDVRTEWICCAAASERPLFDSSTDSGQTGADGQSGTVRNGSRMVDRNSGPGCELRTARTLTRISTKRKKLNAAALR